MQAAAMRLMPALAAAAAALVIIVPLIAYFASTQPAQAAAAELAQIHQNNLAHHHAFINEDDPAKLAGYFKTQLGFTPAMPRMGQGMAMRGCCVAHFRGGVAGSYVVDTPSGPVSIIVVRDRPGELGLKDVSLRNSQSYYQGAFAHCNLVAVRLGDYTYCAVGTSSVPHEKLTELLGLLVK